MDTFKNIKGDFPIFNSHINLVYADSASTTLKPQAVVKAINEYYTKYPANVHRGVYKIAETATEKYEATRTTVAKFINAKTPNEVVFTYSATDGINMVASGIEFLFQKDSEIVVTETEHHANFLPWQKLAKLTNSKLQVIKYIKGKGLDVFISDKEKTVNLKKYVSSKTKILAISTVSNVIGDINPVKEIIYEAKKINPNILVLVDACQSISSEKIDVSELNCDFLVFSSHKIFGPTGCGVLFGKGEILNSMKPYRVGGGSIKAVSEFSTEFLDAPYRFESGTPPIASVIGLGSALEYVCGLNFKEVKKHNSRLSTAFIAGLKSCFDNKVSIYSLGETGIVAFSHSKIHAHDLAQLLAEKNICVRAGHHCAMPLHRALKVEATLRASFSIYNNMSDVEKILSALKEAEVFFKVN